MTTVHRTPPPGATPFSIYEDPDDHEPPSPSEVYEGDMSFQSDLSLLSADEVMPSIEHDERVIEAENEPELGLKPYRSSYTSRPSGISSAHARRISGVTTTSFVSSLPSEISVASKPILLSNQIADSRYAPRRERPPFRNPSSVRAMQMSSPPPFASFENPHERVKGTYKLATPSRSGRSETPASATGSRRSARSRHDSQGQTHPSPRATPTPQQSLPLVLLHVTILPMQFPYSPDIMMKAMPEWLTENYKLLEDKLQDIVLMRRGVLIPHPRDEYELLEERVLESLELKTPRLLKCGHFVPPADSEEESSEEEEDVACFTDEGTGRGSRMSGGTLTVDEEGELKSALSNECDNASVCADCHHHMKRPGRGVGSGNRKWDIKIYAANGLMRSGAWSAAWSEMERCDVEISPWIPEEVRKDLERKIREEIEAKKRKQIYQAELKRQVEEEVIRLKNMEEEAEEEKRTAEFALQTKIEEEEAERERKLVHEIEEKVRFEVALNDKIDEAKETIRSEFEAQALLEASSVAERFRVLEERLKKEGEMRANLQTQQPSLDEHARNKSRGRPRSSSRRPRMEELPIGTLLKNYLLLLARDQRNIFIVLLSLIIVFLAQHVDPSPFMQLPASSLPSELPMDHLPDVVSSVFLTTTTTATATAISISTATSISTITVTHVEHYSIAAIEAASSSPEIEIVLSASATDDPVASMEPEAESTPVLQEQDQETIYLIESMSTPVSVVEDSTTSLEAAQSTDAAPSASSPSAMPSKEPQLSAESDRLSSDTASPEDSSALFGSELISPVSPLKRITTCIAASQPTAESQAQPAEDDDDLAHEELGPHPGVTIHDPARRELRFECEIQH